jgi:hypothetical protein
VTRSYNKGLLQLQVVLLHVAFILFLVEPLSSTIFEYFLLHCTSPGVKFIHLQTLSYHCCCMMHAFFASRTFICVKSLCTKNGSCRPSLPRVHGGVYCKASRFYWIDSQWCLGHRPQHDGIGREILFHSSIP